MSPPAQAPFSPDSHSASAFIDWFACSFVPPDADAIQTVREWLANVFSVEPSAWKHTGNGWNGYTTRVNLEGRGLLAYGGERQRGTIHLELDAHGCALVPDWTFVRAWGDSVGARITRVDLAHDDFTGNRASIEVMRHWLEEGGFTSAGRPPRARLIDDMGSNEGKTLYIGKRAHGKVLRGYEKGKQLGRTSDPWFRIEVELRNKNREIPWEVVTDPGKYFAGAYPCLAEFNNEQCRLATTRRALELSYDRMERWVGDAAGRALNAMLMANEGDASAVLSRVVRPGLPKRLVGFPPGELREIGH